MFWNNIESWNKRITEETKKRLLNWRHSGFSADVIKCLVVFIILTKLMFLVRQQFLLLLSPDRDGIKENINKSGYSRRITRGLCFWVDISRCYWQLKFCACYRCCEVSVEIINAFFTNSGLDVILSFPDHRSSWSKQEKDNMGMISLSTWREPPEFPVMVLTRM